MTVPACLEAAPSLQAKRDGSLPSPGFLFSGSSHRLRGMPGRPPPRTRRRQSDHRGKTRFSSGKKGRFSTSRVSLAGQEGTVFCLPVQGETCLPIKKLSPHNRDESDLPRYHPHLLPRQRSTLSPDNGLQPGRSTQIKAEGRETEHADPFDRPLGGELRSGFCRRLSAGGLPLCSIRADLLLPFIALRNTSVYCGRRSL